jgi:hypothetical protein
VSNDDDRRPSWSDPRPSWYGPWWRPDVEHRYDPYRLYGREKPTFDGMPTTRIRITTESNINAGHLQFRLDGILMLQALAYCMVALEVVVPEGWDGDSQTGDFQWRFRDDLDTRVPPWEFRRGAESSRDVTFYAYEALNTAVNTRLFVRRLSYQNPVEGAFGLPSASHESAKTAVEILRLVLNGRERRAQADVAETRAVHAIATADLEIDRVAAEVRKIEAEADQAETRAQRDQLEYRAQEIKLAMELVVAQRTAFGPDTTVWNFDQAIEFLRSQPALTGQVEDLRMLDAEIDMEE